MTQQENTIKETDISYLGENIMKYLKEVKENGIEPNITVIQSAINCGYDIGIKDHTEHIVREIEKMKLPYGYKPKSPFPGEAVDNHLKKYGHLPDWGCCRYDQKTDEETDEYNNILNDIIQNLTQQNNETR